MVAELKHALRRSRGGVIGWSVALALYSLLMVVMFDPITEVEGLEELLLAYPPELMVFFGDMAQATTPVGFLDTWYFSYMPLIVGVFAIIAGANLLASDEERGILDLLLAYPVSRTSFFWARLLGFVLATAVILLVAWLSFAISSGGTKLDFTWLEFLWPFLSLFALMLAFGTLALLFSMLLPAARLAAMLSGAILVANFLLVGLAGLNQSLETTVKLTPFYYYQGGKAASGLDWSWLAGLLALSLLFALAAWLIFLRRDIRVGGERSWRLPAMN
ncbi:MAG: ABC transporter permease subunit [Chloroflexota bacterium]|nr:MAG: ABC transporter permease subunit [Chloroflexota bacterium]